MNGIRYILEKLTPITRGMSIRKVVTADRLGAMQDAIHALAAGENLVMGPGLKRGWGSGRARLDINRQHYKFPGK